MVDFALLDRHLCSKPMLSKKRPGSNLNLWSCPFCDRAFRHSAPLEMHICNGWCRGMDFDKKPATPEDVAKVYKVLTGLEMTGELEQLLSDGDGTVASKVEPKKAPQTQEAPPKFSLSHRESIAAYIGTDDKEVRLTL